MNEVPPMLERLRALYTDGATPEIRKLVGEAAILIACQQAQIDRQQVRLDQMSELIGGKPPPSKAEA